MSPHKVSYAELMYHLQHIHEDSSTGHNEHDVWIQIIGTRILHSLCSFIDKSRTNPIDH